MSRRRRPEKREILPDPKFGDLVLSKFMNSVMLDGKTVYACSMLALEARGKEIKTAESLYNNGKIDAVPAAFVKFDAQQCGFCTPGFVVSMRAALDKNPNATPAEIEEALSGNICRCGTYSQMRDAIASLCQAKKGGN